MVDRIIETYFANGVYYAEDERNNTRNNTPLARRVRDETSKKTKSPYQIPVGEFRGQNIDIAV